MAGVYLSYPFCAQKCTYCNFASGVLPRELEVRYVDALLGALGGVTESPPLLAGFADADTVYLGGGTPSQMDLVALRNILELIPGRPWAEATMECAPGTVTRERVRGWVAAGITRVSLGVQSFVDRELARTGRKHNAAVVESDVAILRGEGIEAINIDLIAGLPGQTAASWSESLDWVERIGAPHASVYMLEVDDDSRLGAEILLNGVKYGARDVPGEDAIADFYEIAVERLASMGIARYEISNFARAGFESLHNLKYWRREPYLGFGADAHSFAMDDSGWWRWRNAESAAEYVENPGAMDRVAADAVAERFFLGLRLSKGVTWEPGGSPFDEAIARRVGEGLLERVGSRLRLTNRGVMLSNEVFADFVG